jgi:hypothetical protein
LKFRIGEGRVNPRLENTSALLAKTSTKAETGGSRPAGGSKEMVVEAIPEITGIREIIETEIEIDPVTEEIETEIEIEIEETEIEIEIDREIEIDQE